MKINMLLVLLSLHACLLSQEESSVIKKQLRFEQPGIDQLLIIENINGSIQVEGYDGDEVLLEVKKTIRGESPDARKTGNEEVQVGILVKADFIIVFMDIPCSHKYDQTMTRDQLENGKAWNWGEDCRWDPDYDFKLDYTVKVPRETQLKLTTINEGDIEVKTVHGKLDVQNINGAITLDRVAGPTQVNAINGDVNITYTKNPSTDSRYYSLNGDIKAYFQKGLSADLSFKTFNGEFFTDIEKLETLPPRMEKSESKGKGISYKLESGMAVRAGTGDVKLDFETFNGNVYIKEQ